MVMITRTSLGVSRAICGVSWAISFCAIYRMLADVTLLAGSRKVVREEHAYECSGSKISF